MRRFIIGDQRQGLRSISFRVLVEKLFRWNWSQTVVLKVRGEVCIKCGERLYKQENVRRFEEIRAKLEAGRPKEKRRQTLNLLENHFRCFKVLFSELSQPWLGKISDSDSRMRRSAVSVPANIVEGSARKNKSEYLQFLYIAMSSLAELSYHIRFRKELEYSDTKTYEELWADAQVGTTRNREGLRTLQGLISYMEKSAV